MKSQSEIDISTFPYYEELSNIYRTNVSSPDLNFEFYDATNNRLEVMRRETGEVCY